MTDSDIQNPFSGLAKRLPYSRADVAEAFGDWLALRANLPVSDPHPLAGALLDRNARLLDVAAHLTGRADLQGNELHRSLVLSDFGDSLAVALARVVGTSYDKQSSEHRAICKDLATRGLKPSQTPVVDLGEPSREPAGSGPVNLSLTTIESGATVRPYAWSSRVHFSRELLISDDAGLLALVAAQLSGHASRLEAAQIAAQIAANPTLGDGDQLIVSENSTSATGLDVTSVGEALSLMRTNTTPSGAVANVRGRFLLVPASKEAVATILTASMAVGNAPRLEVIVNSWLSGSDCYLVASPDESPVFIRSFPDSSDGRPEVERTVS